MGLKNKLRIMIKAIKKSNKKDIFKRAYNVIKTGGIIALKDAIIQTSLRGEEQNNSIVNDFNLYRRQQSISNQNESMSLSKITILVYVPETHYYIIDTLDSIKNQNHTNYDVKFIVPSKFNINIKHELFKPHNVIAFNSPLIADLLNKISGIYCFLISAGNTLAPNALSSFANELDKGYSLVYSDECVWNFEDSSIVKHYLKPDFSKYYFYNSLYLEESVCFNKKELINVGAFFYHVSNLKTLINDWTLRFVDKEKKVKHIEKILLLRHYHYEINLKSDDTTNYFNVMNSLKCIKVRVQDNNPLKNNYCQCLEYQDKRVTIIIPITDYLLAEISVKSIIACTIYENYEIILVANKANASSLQYLLETYKYIQICEIDRELSYAQACNSGFKLATGDITVFMQDSIHIVDKEWLETIVKCFSLSFVGGVSPKVLRNDNTIKYAGAISGGFDFSPLPFNGEPNDIINDFSEIAFVSREVSILSASCIAIKSDLFKQLNGFNEIDTPDKFSNVDLSFKIRDKGYSCIYCATSIISTSDGTNWYDNWFDKRSKTGYIYLLKRWMDKLVEDPYFTDSMKLHMLNRIPNNYKIFSQNNHDIKLCNNSRNVLLVSHELSITGAPVALHYAAKALLENGDYPVIIAPYDGSLRQTIVEDGIPVIIDYSIMGDKIWINLAENFDMVVVSTLVCNGLIKHLEAANIPTLWWAHEAKASYEIGALKNTLPETINDNIHLYCGGEYAKKVLLSYRPHLKSNILLYAVPDYANENSSTEYKMANLENKIVFSTIGSIMERKGQDILAKAIMEMAEQDVKHCKFLFIGKKVDAITYAKVQELKNKYPDEVVLIDEVTRSELMEIYKICDCVICPSRDDPMPVFMTEAMMFSKIVICSENTGTAALIQDGVNGFVYQKDDYRLLLKKIIYVKQHLGSLSSMKEKSREAYINNFTMNSFSNNFISIIDTITDKEDK
jgi:O-antigen biosynthesis protein